MRCGNHQHAATRYRVGLEWHTAQHCGRDKCDRKDRCPCRCAGCLGAERFGCTNEAAPSTERIPGLSPLGLCAECKAERAALTVRGREHSAGLGRHEVMPGLCAHGLRVGVCGACVKGSEAGA